MTDDVEPPPDRSPAGRPVRVARFDGFAPADGDPGERAGRGPAGSPSTRVARFDTVAPGAAPAPVARLDLDDPSIADLAAARRRRARRSATSPGTDPEVLPSDGDTDGRGRRGPSGRTGSADPAGAARPSPPTVPGTDAGPDEPSADDLPPDRPLRPDGPAPRGRRRRARVGRLGPDAPDPADPQPDAAADPAAIARELCLRLLTDRARTRQELARALARKGVPAEAAATVLDRFDEVGLIDDAAFAGQWVRSRHTHRGMGRRAIAVELRRKGVADDVAGEALAEVDTASEARRARELVDRKLRSLPVDTPDRRAAAGRRLVGMLARKGYGPGTAYAVVHEALADHGAAADELDGADALDD